MPLHVKDFLMYKDLEPLAVCQGYNRSASEGQLHTRSDNGVTQNRQMLLEMRQHNLDRATDPYGDYDDEDCDDTDPGEDGGDDLDG